MFGQPSRTFSAPFRVRPGRLAVVCSAIIAAGWPVRASAATDGRIVTRYRQMIAANPEEENALDRLWNIARQDGFADQLLADYAKPAAKGDFTNRLIYAQLLHRAGRDDEARLEFARATESNPKSPLPHLALSRMLPPGEAAPELEKALALQAKNAPSFSALLQKLGETWMAAGQPAKAAEAWEKIVALAPENLELRLRLAAFYSEKGMVAPAAMHFNYIDQHGDGATRANALRGLARLHQSTGDMESALKALDRAMALTAAGNWLRRELVTEMIRVSRRANRVADLEARWTREAQANPRAIEPWLQLAELYDQQGNLPAERTVLEKLAVLTPGDAALKLRLGRLLVRLDDLPAAAVQLDAALSAQQSAGPVSADLVFERAELDIRRGDIAAARARVEAFTASSGDDASAGRAVEFYRRYRMFDAIEQRLRKPGADPAALADFLFAQHRGAEARAVLRTLVHPNDAPKERAEAHEHVASLLTQAGETVAAMAELREAARLQPDSRRVQIVLGDALLAAGAPMLGPGTSGQAAREAYAKALALSKTETERSEADHRIFTSFERDGAAPQTSGSSEASRAAAELLAVPLPDSGPVSAENGPLRELIRTLESRALAAKGTDGSAAWLRLARWQFWDRDFESAKAAASQAVTLAPDEPAPRELVVTIALAAGDRNTAINQLTHLAKAVPARKESFLKQIAQIQMQMGRHDEAIATLKDLAGSGSPAALAELATAQQQADRWYDALDTWEHLYKSAKKGRRADYLAPMIRAMQHLEIHQRAAEVLWSAFVEQTEEQPRAGVLQELVAHCRDHGMMPWLLDKLQARAGQSGDSADALALASALKADGRYDEASKRLEGAVRAVPDRAKAEEELAREAEGRRDFSDAAAHYRKRLDVMASPIASDWEKLAVLQEQALDYSASDATRAAIVRRFPRDSDALLACARYFEKWGEPERARDILRGVRAFDPENVPAAATLGRLLESVRPITPNVRREAAECAEAVLAKELGPASEALILPPVPAASISRIQAYLTTFASVAGGAGGAVTVYDSRNGDFGEREWRLEAIRRLALGLAERARQPWIVRWQDAPSPSEKLWALYYAGARKESFSHLATLTARTPASVNRRFALFLCGLRLGAWSELSGWLWNADRNAGDHEAFQSALGEWCAMGNATEIFGGEGSSKSYPLVPDALFAGATPGQLWPCAQVFANRRRLAEAVVLGRRAFEHKTAADSGALPLGLVNWMLGNGDLDHARIVLRAVAAEPADSLDAPAYAALRALFLLVPKNERTAWADQFLDSIRTGPAGASPVHLALCTALLRALPGDTGAGRDALERLVALRFGPVGESSAVERTWNFLLTAGEQFQLWNRDGAASCLWRRALEDRALIELEGDRAAAFAAEMRLRIAAIDLAGASRASFPGQLEEFRREFSAADLIQLAGFLENTGYRSEAVRVLADAQGVDPKIPLPRLLNACAATGDVATGKSAIEHWLSGNFSDPVSAQAALEYLVGCDPDAARSFAYRVLERYSGDLLTLESIARVQPKLGLWEGAETVLHKVLEAHPENAGARLALAQVLLARGHHSKAIDVLKESPQRTPEIDAKTAECLALSGDVVRARVAAAELFGIRAVFPPVAGGTNMVPSVFGRIAGAFCKQGHKEDGLALLSAAAASAMQLPHAAFSLQRELLELLGTDSQSANDSARRARWLRRWKLLAADRPDLLTQYYEKTSSSQWLPAAARRAELVSDWDEGRGSVVAGAWLAAEMVDRGESGAADPVLASLLLRADLPDELLVWLDEHCARANRHDLGRRITEVLWNASPADAGYAIRHARNLYAIGSAARSATGGAAKAVTGTAIGAAGEAGAVLRRAALRVVFAPETAGRLGLAAAECGNAPLARELLETAVAGDPSAKQTGVYLGYARLLSDDHDFTAAKQILRRAFRNPANTDPQPILDYLKKSGRSPATELRDLELSPELRAEAERRCR